MRALGIAGLVVFSGCGTGSGGGGAQIVAPDAGPAVVHLRTEVSGSGRLVSVPQGIDCPATCDATFPSGTVVFVRAEAAPGFTLAGFGGACSLQPCSIRLDADASISARYVHVTHAATVTIRGAGHVLSAPQNINCPLLCSAPVDEGVPLTLTARPESGAVFVGWDGACSGTGPCVVHMSDDVAVAATFAGSASECHGLEPGAPGRAPMLSVMALDGTGFCRDGSSDGSGAVVLPATQGNLQLVARVTDAQGNTRGTVGGFAASLFPQLSGFSGVVNAANGQYSFARWSPAALLTASTAPQTGFARVAENPLGGLVAYVQGDKPVAESYDDELRLRWRLSLPLRPQVGIAADRAGATLVLFDGDVFGPQKTLEGVWIDRDGHASEVFQVLGPQRDWPHTQGFGLAQRVGSGFFIQTQSQWVAQIDSLSLQVDPAPDWLRARPGTALHMVHGGTGYAVLPALVPRAAQCTQTVEVVAPSGVGCGVADFAAKEGSCTPWGISVGYDGTVVQQVPNAPQMVCDRAPCSCEWHWWPGFFR